MSLFNDNPFKISGNALTDDDLETLAKLVSDNIYYDSVIGISTDGERFAEKLEQYTNDISFSHGGLPTVLIVDVVVTTDKSFLDVIPTIPYAHSRIICLAIFSTTNPKKIPSYINCLFQLNTNMENLKYIDGNIKEI